MIKIKSYLNRAQSPYGIAAFRIIVGGLTFVSLFRYVLFGWISRFFYEPKVHFKYPGFSWVEALQSPYMDYLVYFLMIVSVFFVLGIMYRLSAALLFLGFTYLHLIDQSLYLNHYYFWCWILLIMTLIPADSAICLFKSKEKSVEVKSWHYFILRFQVGVVYFFAGLAKINADWLLHAQPMNLWMSSLVDIPIIGNFMGEFWLQFVFSWLGFLYDFTIVLWLLIPKTRPYAYCAVIVFHFFTSLFFPIGLFPLIMTLCALIFFSSDWPVKLGRYLFGAEIFKSQKFESNVLNKNTSNLTYSLIGLFIAFHLLTPLRHFLYPGNVMWNEEGMRFSWKVMLREKNGTVTFRIKDKDTGKTWYKPSHEYLQDYQEEEMSGIPDMILQMAHIIGKKYTDRGHNVEVYADAKASLNGRKFVQLIDPSVNLLDKNYSFKAFDFISAQPTEKPRRLKPLRRGF